jgi:serine/threonine-protein kinase
MPVDTPDPSCPDPDRTEVLHFPRTGPALPDLPSLDHLPTPDLVEAVLAHQRKCWEQGVRVPVARYLEGYAALRADRNAAADIVYQEYMLLAQGEDPALFARYVRQYPQYAEALRYLHDADQVVRQVFRLGPPSTPPGKPPRRFGDYELLEEVGRGGMGVVWKAKQLSLGRVVALKMILAGQLASADAIDRFHNEARAAARLQHPNIVAIHEIGSDAGLHFFTMDLVEGQTLARMIRDNPLPPDRAARYMEIVARAIHHAHNNGVLHRDLKPSNVLIDHNDQPRVTDFGLARQVESDRQLTGTGQVLGTPSYMAPEQATGQRGNVGRASDVYSLGAVLYELLTGRPPFRAATAFDTLVLVVSAEPVGPRQLNPGIPRDLETVCLKCLQKDGRRRYASAADLADDLARFLRREPVRARPVGQLTRAWRWCRRNPVVASLVLLLVGVVAGLAWATIQSVAANRETTKQRDRARDRLVLARDAAHQMLTEVSESPEMRAKGVELLRKQLLVKAVEFSEKLAKEEDADLVARTELGFNLGRLGSVCEELAQLGEAEKAYLRAAAIADEVLEAEPDHRMGLQVLAGAHFNLGRLYRLSGRHSQAERSLERALALNRRLATVYRDERAVRGSSRNQVPIYRALAMVHSDKERIDQTERAHRRALQIGLRLAGAAGADLQDQVQLAETYHLLGGFYQAAPVHKSPQALRAFAAALRLRKDLVKASPANPEFQKDLAKSQSAFGDLLAGMGRHAQAAAFYEQAIKTTRKLVAEHPRALQHAVDLGGMYCQQGNLWYAANQPGKAQTSYDHGIGILEEGLQKAPEEHPVARRFLSITLYQRGMIQCSQDRLKEGARDFDRALDLANDNIRPLIRLERAIAWLKLADHRKGVPALEEAVRMLKPAGQHFFRVGVAWSVAVAAVCADKQLPEGERKQLEETYVRQALTWLGKAEQVGAFKNPYWFQSLQSAPAFNSIRNHPDFQKWHREVVKKHKR